MVNPPLRRDPRFVTADRVLESVARQLFKFFRGRIPLAELRSHGALCAVDVVDRWDGRGCFEAFAAQRIRWAILREVKREIARRRRAAMSSFGDGMVVCDPDELPDATLDVERDAARILAHRALCHLSAAQASLLVCHYYEGETIGELAERLGVSKSTVHDRLARALGQIRKELRIDSAPPAPEVSSTSKNVHGTRKSADGSERSAPSSG